MNGKVELIRGKLQEAQAVVVGAGAGLSTAAGLTYGGERFRRYFGDFIRKYVMTDMYSAGFYPFETQEEKWAYWSRHIYYNRYDQPAGNAYLDLCRLVRDKEYFVLTTNVDHQFWLSGFDNRGFLPPRGTTGCFSAPGPAIKRCTATRLRSERWWPARRIAGFPRSWCQDARFVEEGWR